METSSRERKEVIAIVLNYNGGEEVLSTLESLLAGNVRPEILVIDNASSDNSPLLIQKEFPNLEILPQSRNLGFAAGMNVGIRSGLSRGARFFWLVNNDAKVEKDTLEKLLTVAHSKRSIGLLSPAIFTPEGKPWFLGGRISYGRMRAEHTFSQKSKNSFYPTEYLTGCVLLIPRKTIEKIGFLNEKYFLYYEDVAYSLTAKRAGFQTVVVPNARAFHTEQSRFLQDKIYWLVRSGLTFFREESPWYWRPWISLFLFLRKLKNRRDRLLTPEDRIAREVERAYTDASYD